ncbi:hypothetical protein [Bacillus cereus]|uniref:hypothetical protein n=1 Tax=Bacillus cereus TaxID=1396 RepID=UPI00159BB139
MQQNLSKPSSYGWKQIDGEYYYFSQDGSLLTSWPENPANLAHNKYLMIVLSGSQS